MRWDAVIQLDSICVQTTVFSPVALRVDDALMFLALAGLDEKQFGFSGHDGAICSKERFHQPPDADSVSVHAMHTPLQAVAENTTHQAVPSLLASARQFLHQRQHLFACTIPMNLHLKAEPSKDRFQTHWKAETWEM